ncbi:RecF/RecN/SMC [Phascolomyces articulosus]|uniref:Structural maintenance of chromosomes protein n=1 Tax=Phascolomyces articulosus TaxID=60185 RepID=A0AAD5PEE8_9FUNG|nr:RecF/RecN/SMC [Phascolomyces articulosus]
MGRLVRLEVENFKSYKGQQTIGPFHKFTSIIGPNGSGKSNLMDAISFVLGVHSSHLRSHNLRDMIYRPSALNEQSQVNGYRPTNGDAQQPNQAHVLLIYETSEGREMRFMRIAHISGHAEYRFNDKTVSYAEYNAALEKENILVKAKNFLVFQGDVESVASQNSKDLTKLVEQISGSLEYKEEYDRLKKEQDRAIDESAHTFNKKRGISAEIKQYQEQKKEAENFERLVRQRRDVVVEYLLWKLYHVEQKSTALEKEASERRMAADGATEDHNQLEKQFKEARKAAAMAHREKTKTELQIKKVKKQLEEQGPELLGMEEQVKHIQKKLDQTKKTGERLKREHDQQQNMTKLQKASQEYEVYISLGEGNIQSWIKNQLFMLFKIFMDNLYILRKQQVNIQAVNEKQQLENLKRQYRMEQEHLKQTNSKTEEFQARKVQLLEDQRQLIEDGDALTSEAQTLAEELEKQKKTLETLENERQSTHKREVELNEQLQDVLNKLMEAKIGQKESEKETKFNECLNLMKQIFPGMHGKLSDLCRPTQRKYDVAVATVLGRNMDSIIVDDQKTAIDCIQYMRDQRAGTATFIPLSSISVPPLNDRFRNYTRGSRLAFDIIECDKKFESVIQYACANSLVCDNMNIAKDICYNKNEEVKAVTLDGTVIHKSGLMTGGQSQHQKRPRWQERDIDGLLRSRDKLLAELNELNKHKRMGSTEQAVKSQCTGLEAQLSVLREEITTLERKLQDVRGELRYVEEQISNADAPSTQTQEKINTLSDSIEQTKTLIAQVEDSIFGDFCQRLGIETIRDYEKLQLGIPEEVLETRAQFAAQRSRLETQLLFEKEQWTELGERLAYLEKQYQENHQWMEQYQTKVHTMKESLKGAKEDMASFNAELYQHTIHEDEKQQVILDLRHHLESKGRDVESYLKEMLQFETEIEKVHAERVSIFRKCKLEDIDLPMSRGSLDDVMMDESTIMSNHDMNSMEIEDPSQSSIQSTDWMVEVDYSKLDDDLRNDNDMERENVFKENIKQLGEKIDQMAPNLKAIDRLEGVEQRLKEVEASFDTARKAAKRAKEAFNNVKQKRYKRFYDAYSHISERIDEVYKDLTKNTNFPAGGTAYLSLEDTEEPYLNGIRYHAMPPMKRFRDMDQLSGGEKSIAALALLFAIHSFKPSPFFVLDEVDAALDNTNVIKIASYIREHANDSFQFIVISLKNTLYEKAESLVGIYRDQGINSSKTLSLMVPIYLFIYLFCLIKRKSLTYSPCFFSIIARYLSRKVKYT